MSTPSDETPTPATPASPGTEAYAQQLIELAISQQHRRRPVLPREPGSVNDPEAFTPLPATGLSSPASTTRLHQGHAMSEKPATPPAAAAPQVHASPQDDSTIQASGPTRPAPSAQAAPWASALQEMSGVSKTLNLRVLIGLGLIALLMIISLVMFAAIGLKVSGKISQLDATVLAVGKRTVELEAGLQALAVLSKQMTAVNTRQDELMRAQAELKTQIESAIRQSTSVVAQVPQQAAKELAASQEGLSKQVRSLDGRLQSQAGAVSALGKDVQTLQQSVAGVPALRRDIETLVTLQRERTLEQLQKQATSVRKEPAPVRVQPAVPQYPRPSPPAGADTPASPTRD